MSKTWLQFASSVRCSIVGSLMVSELLYAILDGEHSIISRIKNEHVGPHNKSINKLIEQAELASTTIGGRVDVRRLADLHAYIAGLPVDDLAIRRAYNNWVKQAGQSNVIVAMS